MKKREVENKERKYNAFVFQKDKKKRQKRLIKTLQRHKNQAEAEIKT